MTVMNTATGLGPGWGLRESLRAPRLEGHREDPHPPSLRLFTILFSPVLPQACPGGENLALSSQAYEPHPSGGRKSPFTLVEPGTLLGVFSLRLR